MVYLFKYKIIKVFDKLQNVFAFSSNSNPPNIPIKFKINGNDYFQEKLIEEVGYVMYF